MVAMIVLDTNQVRGRHPDGVALQMVRKIADQTNHGLILPELVFEEYMAHYQHKVEQAVKMVKGGISDLRRMIPSWPVEVAFLDSLEEHADKTRRDKLAQLFGIHPTPQDALREALLREAQRRPPAKTSWEKAGSGARDAVIRLTILDACVATQEETYFVTDNSSDFGKDGSLRPELAKELRDQLGQDSRFHYCADISALMSQLGVESASPPADDTIGSAHVVQAAVESALADDQADFEFVDGIPNLALKFVGGFGGIQGLRFSNHTDKVEAYQIGEDTWACTRGEWDGWRECTVMWNPGLVVAARARQVRLDFKVNATVVMRLDAQGTIVAAEVTDRSRVAVKQQALE